MTSRGFAGKVGRVPASYGRHRAEGGDTLLGDILHITQSPVTIGASGYVIPLVQRIDIAGYDQLDVWINCLKYDSPGGGKLRIDFASSMQDPIDDLVAGSPPTFGSWPGIDGIDVTSVTAFKLQLKSSSVAMFAYLRWTAFLTTATSVTVDIRALARRFG